MSIYRSQFTQTPFPTGILHVYLSRLKKNIETIRKHAVQTSGNINLKYLLPVKANAYGHGMVQIAQFVQDEHLCEYLGVAHLTEAHTLRQNGISLPILVHGQINSDEESLRYVVENDIEIEISEPSVLKHLQKIAFVMKKTAKVHLSVDTGMGRTGALPKDIPKLLNLFALSKHIHLTGVMTHFSVADEQNENDKSFTKKQIEIFRQVKTEVQKLFKHTILFHAANSAGAEYYRDGIFDMIRPGIASYGYGSGVEPVMELTTSITLIKEYPDGHPIGYGRTYRTSGEHQRFGIIPIGYGDGFPRALSNKAHVIINGTKRKLAGRISMDQCTVELGEDDTIGDEVVIIGKQKNTAIYAYEVAKLADTIPYEVLCSLGNAKRLRHEYH